MCIFCLLKFPPRNTVRPARKRAWYWTQGVTDNRRTKFVVGQDLSRRFPHSMNLTGGCWLGAKPTSPSNSKWISASLLTPKVQPNKIDRYRQNVHEQITVKRKPHLIRVFLRLVGLG